MQLKTKDKRIKALNAGKRGVKGLQPEEEAMIIEIIAVLLAAPNLTMVASSHRSWRVHHYSPKKPSSLWSIDVAGSTRLLFYYDKKSHSISGLHFYDPHP